MKTIIQTPTPNNADSLQFYEKIGFELITVKEKQFATSSEVIIEINQNEFSRIGLKILGLNWNDFLVKNNLLGIASETPTGFLIVSPEGCCVYLEEIYDGVPNKSITKPLIGTYGGFSLETNKIEQSVEFWTKFGYKKTKGNLEHGWIVLENAEGFAISLMKYQCCPHLFFNPSLSYFNGKDNLKIIEAIRRENIVISQEIKHFNNEGIVDNIIIRDPGGLGFFVFND